MTIGKNLKQLVAFDLDREPIGEVRSRITEFHAKIAAERGNSNFNTDVEEKKEERVQLTGMPFNYYAIYGTKVGSKILQDSLLASQLHNTLLQKSVNLIDEVTCPRDFEHMKGFEGKEFQNCMTDEFSFKFSEK